MNTYFQNASASLGAAVDDVEPETALEVGEDLALDDRRLSLAFTFPRHLEEIKGTDAETQSWRMRERMKTVRFLFIRRSAKIYTAVPCRQLREKSIFLAISGSVQQC